MKGWVSAGANGEAIMGGQRRRQAIGVGIGNRLFVQERNTHQSAASTAARLTPNIVTPVTMVVPFLNSAEWRFLV